MRTNREKAAIIWREKEQILMVFLLFLQQRQAPLYIWNCKCVFFVTLCEMWINWNEFSRIHYNIMYLCIVNKLPSLNTIFVFRSIFCRLPQFPLTKFESEFNFFQQQQPQQLKEIVEHKLLEIRKGNS